MSGKVGFIGVGHMGGPMAMHLLKNDFAVVVYDADPAKVTPLARAAGLNHEDHGAVIKVLEQFAGVKVSRKEA